MSTRSAGMGPQSQGGQHEVDTLPVTAPVPPGEGIVGRDVGLGYFHSPLCGTGNHQLSIMKNGANN